LHPQIVVEATREDRNSLPTDHDYMAASKRQI
jgi:hypothetical protein